jgi:hypothetical protein
VYKEGSYYLISPEYYIDRVKSHESNLDVWQKLGAGDEAFGKQLPWSTGELVKHNTKP